MSWADSKQAQDFGMFQAVQSRRLNGIGQLMNMRLTLACLLVCGLVFQASAESLTCEVCGEAIQGIVYHANDLAVGGDKMVCQACAALHEHCFACGLPVKSGYKTLPDGRLLCARDAREAIESDEEALQICGTVRDDLDRIFSRFLIIPETNVLISIVNRFYLENLFNAPASAQACVSVFGATTSNPIASNKMVHAISLLSHLRKSRLMAVCAHEYTHAWMGENGRPLRLAALDRDTVEGFCELVACKYMEDRQESFEVQVIKKNDYTKDKITVMLEADSRYGFGTVVEWMKSGEDTKLELANLDRIREVEGASLIPAAALTAPTVGTVSPAPDTLMLKGISGTTGRRFALINDATFELMERGKVRVGQTNVTLRCLEIHDESVTVQLDGSNEKKQLFLPDR